MTSRRISSIYSAAAKIVEVQLSNQQSLSSYCIASEVYLHYSECLVRPTLNTFHIVVVECLSARQVILQCSGRI